MLACRLKACPRLLQGRTNELQTHSNADGQVLMEYSICLIANSLLSSSFLSDVIPHFLQLFLSISVSPRMASGMQEKQYNPSLLSFFIYNPKFGPREGEVRIQVFIIYTH